MYAVDSRTLFIKNFAYDGQGPDAYFYAGESGEPSSKGYLIANEKARYINHNYFLSLLLLAPIKIFLYNYAML